jgi:hypothetical protein
MRKRYKIVLNVEITDPDRPYPSGGDYTHLNMLEGVIKNLAWAVRYLAPEVTLTVDKVIDKGKVEQ